MDGLTILTQGNYGVKELDKIKEFEGLKIIDLYESQINELFEIRNPQLIFSPDFSKQQNDFVKENTREIELVGDWIYYPWRNSLVHVVSESDYFELRTNRNRNLITKEEQQKLRNSTLAFAGLSIGSSALESMVYSGIGNNYVISDFDILETSNLNRIKATLLDVGASKLEIAIRRSLEIDPYLKFMKFEQGLTDENCNDFVNKKPRLIFEAIDSLKIKIILRQLARDHKIPVVMLTNLGDGVMIDIERYDLSETTPLFNGRIEEKVISSILHDEINKENINNYVLQMVGIENIPKKAIESVLSIGKELVGRPQLSTSVGISGNIAAYVARQVILEKNVKSGRKLIKFDGTLLP